MSFEKVVQHARQIALLESASFVIEWDERTYMPAAAGAYRAEQLTLLSGLLHSQRTDKAYGDWLNAARDEVADDREHGDRATIVRVLHKDFKKATKLPQALVEQITKNSIEGQQAWVKAREARDFGILLPFLETTIGLKREQAQALGFEHCMYDALLDEFEPGEQTSRVRQVFANLREQLVPLIQSVANTNREMPVDVLSRSYPLDAQREIGLFAARQIGFDFDEGRLDVTDHPFCTTLGPRDIRLTTRYDENFFPSAFFGTLHEAGHGIYEQGLRKDYFGLPPGKYCSTAIHESQSRLWENFVGRSESFWTYLFPKLQRHFPNTLSIADQSAFFQAINQVKPTLIRIEADEVTYNLHIIIRFELEQELIDGQLAVADLPDAWNDRYEKLLGINPPHDGDGVLQDIHWSAALIGYFPTYALGNLYAAQFFDQAERELGDVNQQFGDGEFSALHSWLKKNIYERGQCYTSAELVEQVTGEPLSEKPLVNRLRAKLERVYGI